MFCSNLLIKDSEESRWRATSCIRCLLKNTLFGDTLHLQNSLYGLGLSPDWHEKSVLQEQGPSPWYVLFKRPSLASLLANTIGLCRSLQHQL